MKLALFKSTEYSTSIPQPCGEWMEVSKGYARVSEYVDVEFPPLADEAVIKQQLDALDRTEQELREQFQRHLNGINDRRAELQALTFVPAS
jgi:hypothetical protein